MELVWADLFEQLVAGCANVRGGSQMEIESSYPLGHLCIVWVKGVASSLQSSRVTL